MATLLLDPPASLHLPGQIRSRKSPNPGPPRVLVADDSSSGRLMMSQMLCSLDLRVEAVENGRVACDRVLSAWKAGKPFDLVLMDSQMPVVDGTEATRLIRKAGYPGLIVALTPEYDFLGVCESCLEAGCDGYARKPITFPTIRGVVRKHVPGRSNC